LTQVHVDRGDEHIDDGVPLVDRELFKSRTVGPETVHGFLMGGGKKLFEGDGMSKEDTQVSIIGHDRNFRPGAGPDRVRIKPERESRQQGRFIKVDSEAGNPGKGSDDAHGEKKVLKTVGGEGEVVGCAVDLYGHGERLDVGQEWVVTEDKEDGGQRATLLDPTEDGNPHRRVVTQDWDDKNVVEEGLNGGDDPEGETKVGEDSTEELVMDRVERLTGVHKKNKHLLFLGEAGVVPVVKIDDMISHVPAPQKEELLRADEILNGGVDALPEDRGE
jgi:hypothetical protein